MPLNKVSFLTPGSILHFCFGHGFSCSVLLANFVLNTVFMRYLRLLNKWMHTETGEPVRRTCVGSCDTLTGGQELTVWKEEKYRPRVHTRFPAELFMPHIGHQKPLAETLQ